MNKLDNLTKAVIILVIINAVTWTIAIIMKFSLLIKRGKY